MHGVLAGTHAALAPGNYTLRLPGRSGCTARGDRRRRRHLCIPCLPAAAAPPLLRQRLWTKPASSRQLVVAATLQSQSCGTPRQAHPPACLTCHAGFLSARACSHPFPKTVTLTPELTLSAGTGLQVWQLQPVAAGVTAIKNTTKVYLKVGLPWCRGAMRRGAMRPPACHAPAQGQAACSLRASAARQLSDEARGAQRCGAALSGALTACFLPPLECRWGAPPAAATPTPPPSSPAPACPYRRRSPAARGSSGWWRPGAPRTACVPPPAPGCTSASAAPTAARPQRRCCRWAQARQWLSVSPGKTSRRPARRRPAPPPPRPRPRPRRRRPPARQSLPHPRTTIGS